jgi:hypothetical protein
MDELEIAFWKIKTDEEDDPDDPRIIQRDLLEPSYKCGPTSRRRRAKLHFFCLIFVLLTLLIIVVVAVYLFTVSRR